jgi:uncharacterized protein (TIGR02284 family)
MEIAMSDKEAVSVLNELIVTSEDGEKGFKEAAEIAEDPRLKTLFAECASDCRKAVTQLQSQVSALGGKAEHSGSVAGAAHRGWIKVKATVENKDIAVLEEVERGEDRAKAAYTKALKANLPAAALSLVKEQQVGALRNHDRVRDLRNEFKARAA